jgi:hypothetical protein
MKFSTAGVACDSGSARHVDAYLEHEPGSALSCRQDVFFRGVRPLLDMAS